MLSAAGGTLFTFVDLKDPYALTGVAEEPAPGPILSLLGARRFDTIVLFYTRHAEENAAATGQAIADIHPSCRVIKRPLAVADPKHYSSIMGLLAESIRDLRTTFSDGSQNFICVSSGTAEMRTAWFLLNAARVLPGTLLQVGSPAEPLFGPAHVEEVDLASGDWNRLRDLVMPMEFFKALEEKQFPPPLRAAAASPHRRRTERSRAEEPRYPGLDDALQELGISIGSAALRLAAERIWIAAPTTAPILILGETGTGKEMFARLAHKLSDRSDRPITALNCAAIPKELVESYLFGHVKGAFTGATNDQVGRFERADGGTLFLDEIGELPVEAQAKLLRALQEGEIERVGSNKPARVDVRVMAATNRDLEREIREGRFREDLYYRLEVVHVQLPPLRERRSEIPQLALALLKRFNQRMKRQRQLSKEALQRLEQFHWPGNVRELSNVIERSVLYARSDVLAPDDLIITERKPQQDPLASLPDPEPGFSLEAFLAQARKQLFLRALEKARGNQSVAADLLGVSRQAVHTFVKGQV